MSPDSTRRASAWKAQCGSVRSLLTERGWLSAPQVRKVGEAMGVPFPLLVCEYLASAKFIDRLQGVVTFYGPEGLPFESQYVVKKITKPPLSLTELRVIKAVENGYSTPAEIATLFNCSRQWIDMVAAHLIEQGFLARERDSSRVRLSRSPKTLPSENKAEIYYDLEMPQPVQRP